MSRRLASVAAEQKTREELAAAAEAGEDDGDAPEDGSFELKDASQQSKKRKAPGLAPRRGAGGGICLSDDEEQQDLERSVEGTQASGIDAADAATATATAAAAVPAAARGSSGDQPAAAAAAAAKTTGAAEADAAAPEATKVKSVDGSTSMAALMARINKKPKKGKKRGKKGGTVMDKSLASLLRGDDESGGAAAGGAPVDKEAASKAAKAALAMAGKMRVSEEVMFAGQRLSVARTLDKSSEAAKRAMEEQAKSAQQSTLDKVVHELKNSKKSLSAVEKSSYDWDKFKQDKGIADQLEAYAKDGYVEKQQFLQRVDQRTFEVERAERDRARAAAALAQDPKKKK